MSRGDLAPRRRQRQPTPLKMINAGGAPPVKQRNAAGRADKRPRDCESDRLRVFPFRTLGVANRAASRRRNRSARIYRDAPFALGTGARSAIDWVRRHGGGDTGVV